MTVTETLADQAGQQADRHLGELLDTMQEFNDTVAALREAS
jgi:hypothetical protein